MQKETTKSTANSNTFSKKIGRTTYDVHIFFSKTSKESFNDKLLRLIKNDIANGTKRT
ncbi:MAG: transposon-encoded TnpW family protein [Defluviitaleaceae bacterium]|nr:transposon-encoded TnpW family protein [Defluviitaleaceae bacterium]